MSELPTAQDVEQFCLGCDHADDPYPEHCKGISTGAAKAEGLDGYSDQFRYAYRGWCNCADVHGVRGRMTKKGFVPQQDVASMS